MHELFEQQAKNTPNATAVVFKDKKLTYKELNEKANQLAHYLVAHHQVKADTLIGLCITRSIEMMIGMLGILKAGGAYVPMDPDYPKARLDYMLEDAGLNVVLTLSHVQKEVSFGNAHALCLDGLGQKAPHIQSVFDDFAIDNLETRELGLNSSHLAYVIYTSGSTGNPKGVLTPHIAVSRLVINPNFMPLDQDTVFLQSANIAFDAATLEIWGGLLNGGKCILYPERYLDINRLNEIIVSEQVNALWLTAGLFSEWSRVSDKATTLKWVLAGGDVLNPDAVMRVQKMLPQVTLINGYGPTENTTFTCCYQIPKVLEGDSPIAIGRPLSGDQVVIMSDEGNLLPMGATGELCVGGDGLARGYLNSPELTAERFIDNPYYDESKPNSSRRLYKTGDLVRYLKDSNIEFIGRIDAQIKIRGFRVELGEIEYQINQDERVDSALVVAKETSSGGKQLIGYVKLSLMHETADVEKAVLAQLAEIKGSLLTRMPDYMVPSAFVKIEEWPLTANGKVDRKSLPQADDSLLQGEYVGPQTDTEKALVNIWSGLLNLEADKISTTANFFELGGDSILSIQLVSQANQLGMQLTVKQLFDNQNIAELATKVTYGMAVEAPQNPIKGALNLLPIQQVFFEDETDLHHFNQSVLLTTPVGFEPLHLNKLVTVLYQRHDALRLRFALQEGKWQALHCPLDPKMVEQSISHLYLDDSDFSSLEDKANEIQRSLNLSEGPILRLVHVTNQGQEGRLLLIVHHLVIDGVSWRILLEDAERWMAAIRMGKTSVLPAKTSSFQQWGDFLTEYAFSNKLAAEKGYWARMNDISVNDLPEVPSKLTGTSVENFGLDQNLTTQLLQQAGHTYRTQINELLLCSVFMGFNQWSGNKSIRIALEGHGREDLTPLLDLSQTVGWFTSIYPLVLSSKSMNIQEVICSIKEQYRAVPCHGIGYGVLRYLTKDESLIESQAIDIAFNYLGQFDQVITQDSYFGSATESRGLEVSHARKIDHGITLNGAVTGGTLSFNLNYDLARFSEKSMQSLAQSLEQALKDVISHCLSPNAGRLTISDFPLAKMNLIQLDTWQAKYDIANIYKATPMQQGMLFHSLLDKNAYVTQIMMTLEGNLNTALFREAWQSVVARHDIFRTIFVGEDSGEIQQLVLTKATLPWSEFDMTESIPEVQQQLIHAYRQNDLRKGFELTIAPLMRITLWSLGNHQHQLLWSHHHALNDGWCLSLVFGEVIKVYQNLKENERITLPAVIPYRNYIAWLAEQDEQAAREFWRASLSDIDVMTALPLEKDIGQGCSGLNEIVTVSSEFTDEETKLLSQFARKNQLTMNVLVQAAWAFILSRYSGENSVVFGTTVSGRPPELLGVEQMVGLFINTVAVRIDIEGNIKLGEWLTKLHHSQVTRDEHCYLSLSEVQRLANLSGKGELFDSLLVFENYPVDDALEDKVDLSGLQVSSMEAFDDTNFGLMVKGSLRELLTLDISYKTARFDSDDMNILLDQMHRVLKAMIEQVEQPVWKLPLLSYEEQNYLIKGFANTSKNYLVEQCIHQIFETQVEKSPHKIALIFNGKNLTYEELNNQSNQLAQYLSAQGVKRGSIVGICIARSMEMVISLLAILKTGAAYAPLDPSYPQERLDYMMENSAIKLLVTHSDLSAVYEGKPVKAIKLDDDKIKQALSAHKTENLQISNGLSPDDLAFVIYTSGSTGRPKGVMQTHRTMVNLAQGQILDDGMHGALRTLQFAPISFDASIHEMTTCWLTGSELFLMSEQSKQNLVTLPDILHDNKIERLFIPPAVLNWLSEAVNERDLHLINLKEIATSGEALVVSSDLAAFLEQHHHCKLWNYYGPTETHVATIGLVNSPKAGDLPSIGKPIENVSCYVLDKYLQLAPMGTLGELWVGGMAVAKGYINRPELTAERFIDDPFSQKSSDKLYKTGDLVRYLPDGNIEFIGRTDDQVKMRGYRIELSEIEQQLLSIDAVKRAVVLVREDEPGLKHLAAYVTTDLEDDGELITKMQDHAYASLPEFMVPTYFMILDALPLTANGKVNKKALPVPERVVSHEVYVAPKTEIEKSLVQVWSQLLGLDSDKISITANIFELGAHSLLMLKAIHQMKKVGIDSDLKALYESSCIQEFAMNYGHNHLPIEQGSIIALNKTTNGNPLYVFHPFGGRCDGYRKIALSLEGICPVIGIQAPFNFNHELNFDNFSELGEFYKRAIKQHRPEGPYQLCGWSAGGNIAGKVAELMLAQGDEISYLAILDSLMIFPNTDLSDSENLRQVLKNELNSEEDTLSGICFTDKLGKEFENKSLDEQIINAAELILQSDKEVDYEPEQIKIGLKFGTHLMKTNWSVAPLNISGKSVLFAAEGNTEQEKKNILEAWQKTLLSSDEVITVPGIHGKMMHGDCIEKIIDKLVLDISQFNNQFIRLEPEDEKVV
ncbi:non-ribosomal peptide synthetase [Pseudoalteromonas denitrificans]|uniref:non-ribosomal peptide synthetase n=1 Tax=Pseudoalteromonas denitrificans TaxID=43656 RepID=UPI001FE3A097|nr:non-ribosomal peptide synthetase [Pseudoalteromonas denitrificans]